MPNQTKTALGIAAVVGTLIIGSALLTPNHTPTPTSTPRVEAAVTTQPTRTTNPTQTPLYTTPSASPITPTPVHIAPTVIPATPTPIIPTQAPLSNGGGYTNKDGNKIPSPTHSNTVPVGASAQCRDGTYSFSQHRQGTCSHHGGVASWL